MKKVYYLCAAMAVLKYLNDHADKEHYHRLELRFDGEHYWIIDIDESADTPNGIDKMDAERLFKHLEGTLTIAAGKKVEIDLDDAFYSFVRGIELPVIFEE